MKNIKILQISTDTTEEDAKKIVWMTENLEPGMSGKEVEIVNVSKKARLNEPAIENSKGNCGINFKGTISNCFFNIFKQWSSPSLVLPRLLLQARPSLFRFLVTSRPSLVLTWPDESHESNLSVFTDSYCASLFAFDKQWVTCFYTPVSLLSEHIYYYYFLCFLIF